MVMIKWIKNNKITVLHLYNPKICLIYIDCSLHKKYSSRTKNANIYTIYLGIVKISYTVAKSYY